MMFTSLNFAAKSCCYLSFIAVGACSMPKVEPSIKQLEKSSNIVLLTDTAETSTTAVLNPEDKMFLCANNAPDATFSANMSRGADFSIAKTTNNADDKNTLARGLAGQEMTGRTPAVLSTREYLYRTCELIRNLNLDKKEAIELFKHAIDQSAKILQSETQNTTITISDTLSDTISQSDTNSQTSNQAIANDAPSAASANSSSDQGAGDASDDNYGSTDD